MAARTKKQPGYYPTYAIREDLDEKTRRWLAAQQGDGPLDCIDVTDVCATFEVTAELRDVNGRIMGTVDAKGDYTPADPAARDLGVLVQYAASRAPR